MEVVRVSINIYLWELINSEENTIDRTLWIQLHEEVSHGRREKNSKGSQIKSKKHLLGIDKKIFGDLGGNSFF